MINIKSGKRSTRVKAVGTLQIQTVYEDGFKVERFYIAGKVAHTVKTPMSDIGEKDGRVY